MMQIEGHKNEMNIVEIFVKYFLAFGYILLIALRHLPKV